MVVKSRVQRVAGRTFSRDELRTVAEIVAKGVGLSRTQLMVRVCERLDWRRATGACKVRECRDLLLQLESDGWFELPLKRAGRPVGSRTRVPLTAAGEPGAKLVGSVGEFGTLSVELVGDAAGQRLFRELVGRYHYLSYRVPFGAHLRYLAFLSKPRRAVVAAVQLSSPAWRLAARDRWIGWDDPTRERNLQRVVGNSRFVVLPWIRVRNLASRLLSLLMRQVGADWQARYGVTPLLAETMVDVSRHRGTCYRAANWIELGQTTGRGRMDREHRLHGHAPKRILVYPLAADAARHLREA
jgi:Druantia protein DruA